MTTKADNHPDDLMIGGLKMFQGGDAFRFGTDAVLLSDYVEAKGASSLIDLGTGSGILPLLLSVKTDVPRIKGIEIRPEAARLAQKNVAYNHLEERIEIVEGDIKDAPGRFGKGSFKVVVTNPPYIKQNAGLMAEGSRSIARAEIAVTLAELLEAASALLPEKGLFFMVHRAERLAEIIDEMKRVRIEPKKMRLVYPYSYKEAKLVLVMGIKGGGSQMRVEPPFILYNDDGSETDELRDIYTKYA